jgi:two-component system NarL family response regulator
VSPGRKIRILVADDHPLMRVGLVTTLNLQRDMAVVGEASTGRAALELYAKHRPDVLILDLRMPDLPGNEVLTRLRARHPDAQVVVLSSYDAPESIFRCLQAGAQSYLSKEVPLEEMLHAIRSASLGQRYLPAEIGTRLAQRLQEQEPTGRELDVLRGIVRGWTNKEIASKLSITEYTVKEHVSSAMRKLNAGDRTQAGVIAIQRGWVELQ